MVRYFLLLWLSLLVSNTIQSITLINKTGRNLYFVLYLINSDQVVPETFSDYQVLSKKELWGYTFSAIDRESEIEITTEQFNHLFFDESPGTVLRKIGLVFHENKHLDPHPDAQFTTISFDTLIDIEGSVAIEEKNNAPKIAKMLLFDDESAKKEATDKIKKKKKKKIIRRLSNFSISPRKNSSSFKDENDEIETRAEYEKDSPTIAPRSCTSENQSPRIISPRKRVSIDSPRANKQIKLVEAQLTPVTFYNASPTIILTLQLFHTGFGKKEILLTKTINPESSMTLSSCFFNDFLKKKIDEGRFESPPIQLLCWYQQEDSCENPLELFKFREMVVIQQSKSSNKPHIPCLALIESSTNVQTQKSELE